MTDKTIVLITGANQGLGYYATQHLAATGKYHVLLGSRNLLNAEEAIKELAADSSVKVDATDLESALIDVTSDESINVAAKVVEQKYGRLDILMVCIVFNQPVWDVTDSRDQVNAGIMAGQHATPDGKSLRELYSEHYNTNLFGAAQTVESFLPLLRKSVVLGGKRIAFTSSGTASLEWASQDGLYSAENWPIYRSTKTALSMIMLGYAKRLEKEGFVVSASDPGYCGTNINGFTGFKHPRDGAKVLVRAAVEAKENVHAHVVDEEKFVPW